MSKQKNLWDIPSFKYRHAIKQLVKPLEKYPQFSAFALGLILRSGKRAWLSSVPHVTVKAVHAGLDRSEILLQYDFVKQSRVIFPSEFLHYDSLQEHNNCLRQEKGNHRAYVSSYYCDDCCMIISYSTKEKSINEQKVYQQTIDDVIIVSSHVLQQLLPALLHELPELKSSRFANDSDYRQKIITTRPSISHLESLTQQEIAILYWSARGKTAIEIGTILSLSKNTVDTYRRSLINKMDVTNITQAVYLALSSNIIT